MICNTPPIFVKLYDLLKILMKKFTFSKVTGLKPLPATIPKMNSFIYYKIITPVRKTCEESKFLVKLLADSLEYTTKQ